MLVFVAAGLYYLAELVEEYTVISKKVIWWMNTVRRHLTLTFTQNHIKVVFVITKITNVCTFQVVLIVYIGLWLFEGFPLLFLTFGSLAQITHYVILKDFPYVTFLSPGFIASVVFIIINHYLAFQHFATVYYTFSEVNQTGFFAYLDYIIAYLLIGGVLLHTLFVARAVWAFRVSKRK